ncbi:MAG: bifunctional [glutamate--ammonia ligase]-adenylyl-L-tyrosine phosphorylase/[glutamate--ammonia-ligase] adenylyltransferase [Gammaproteobacteria bacterium]|nr:bifunctional [glutamate--ammonia ligase]-adenylyl-L-tyrosine phosphorylase/[glutamate--ammonia-ligase] adenylyltransferase [Gammaproteobacteria bacterium]
MSQFKQLIEPDILHWKQLKELLQHQGFSLRTDFAESLQKLALGSNYAISQLIKYPELIHKLHDCDYFELDSASLTNSLEGISDVNIIQSLLRKFRHQKLVEIIYLDICLQQNIEDTLLHLSELADTLIQLALNKCEQILSVKHGQPLDELGQPMQLNIIAMGKLGGRELNFSSDIDLICCYSDDGQLAGFGQLTHTQYFTHIVKLFNQLLHELTADGFVYRVDLRLRPWGEAGPKVLSHNAFEHYYQLHGREWEQYAMVKARVITGSDADKKYLHSILKPFIYRRYHDYRVFDGLATLKSKIDQQSRRNRSRCNIKTGRGGIREIEFFVQAFQILKGGRNHQLQTQSLFLAIDTLTEQNITDHETLLKMRESYCFLRLLENRIQMLNDQQTHELPTRQNTQDRLCLLLGYANWQALEIELNQHLSQVNEVFSTLFKSAHNTPQLNSTIQHFDELNEDQHLQVIQQLGFKQTQEIHQRLQQFYLSRSLIFMSDRARKRFHVFFPELLKQISQYDQQLELLEKLLALLSSIAGRSVYFELLYQNIPLLVKLAHLFDSSNWIAAEVTRHPILLESLLYPDKLEDRFDKLKQQHALQVQLQNVKGDEELELDVLRQFKRAQTIMIATAEIAGEIDTTTVSYYLSDLAEILLQAVYELSLSALIKQYGQPQCLIENESFTPGLAIIGYGKLGGYELHYQSDLDIIFLHNSSGSKQQTSGSKSIDNAVFFSRLAQKIISKISLLTAAGKLYEIDTRLRPNGSSGMLVTSLQAFHQYQCEKAWVWEHQSIIRARYIAGNADIKPEFEKIRQLVIALKREPAELGKVITDMREKIYQNQKPAEGPTINSKHSRGCMVDIEFLVQYWVLKYANKFASLTESTDNIGLISELHRLGLISDEDLQLRDCYPVFHKWLHTQVLQNQSADIASGLVRKEIDVVKNCWNKTFN